MDTETGCCKVTIKERYLASYLSPSSSLLIFSIQPSIIARVMCGIEQ